MFQESFAFIRNVNLMDPKIQILPPSQQCILWPIYRNQPTFRKDGLAGNDKGHWQVKLNKRINLCLREN